MESKYRCERANERCSPVRSINISRYRFFISRPDESTGMNIDTPFEHPWYLRGECSCNIPVAKFVSDLSLFRIAEALGSARVRAGVHAFAKLARYDKGYVLTHYKGNSSSTSFPISPGGCSSLSNPISFSRVPTLFLFFLPRPASDFLFAATLVRRAPRNCARR